MIYEKGKQQGNFGEYQAGSRVEALLHHCEGKVEYHVDGQVRYTSQQKPKFPLHVKICAHGVGPLVKDVQWIGKGFQHLTQERFDTLCKENQEMTVALAAAKQRASVFEGRLHSEQEQVSVPQGQLHSEQEQVLMLTRQLKNEQEQVSVLQGQVNDLL